MRGDEPDNRRLHSWGLHYRGYNTDEAEQILCHSFHWVFLLFYL
jgi:hypothetical protein